ncbi:MFS transporter [Planosporangium mesophilum]|uniref:MFS transporter n=1 Tax=Planosporangium mesophilum TaxID=689768 RepID=A0A8J3X3B6_9ACTN|nr:MFS transporter [Planosporangium mesophilum]NJC86730.1 MFS transporter [Planosporangium mesophilum]GII26407.1 MFS transporter [Planosporangium mesophilum]
MKPIAGTDQVLIRARVATSLLFLLFGITLGTWTARIPAVKHGLSLSDGQLSLALLAFAAGAITGMQAIGRAVDRFGSRAIMVPVAIGEGLVLIPTAYVPGLIVLATALFVFGAVHGTLNIAMNANAIEVQRAWRRPIMSSFHAIYSIGGFLGAAFGGLFARAEVDSGTNFAVVGTAMVVLAVWSWWWALPPDAAALDEEATDDAGAVRSPRTPGSRGATPGVLFLGVLAFCALVGEGAAADWSAVYLRDSLRSTAGFAAAAYAAFSIMMMVGRLLGDRLAAKLGPVRLVRGCGVLAAVGLAVALLVGHPAAGVAGFAFLGAGMSCIAPQVYTTAGNRNPAMAGRALARVVSIGYVGFLTGPILIGSASTVVGLPGALAIPVMLSLFVALTASALRPAPDHTSVEDGT